MDLDRALLRARARVLHDLAARHADDPAVVDLVEDAVAARRWWVRQWPEGAAYVDGQVAQDVQDRMVDDPQRWGRWPVCPVHADEPLQVHPALGADPQWVCERGCGRVGALGALPPAAVGGAPLDRDEPA